MNGDGENNGSENGSSATVSGVIGGNRISRVIPLGDGATPFQTSMPGIFPSVDEATERMQLALQKLVNDLSRQRVTVKKAGQHVEIVEQFTDSRGTLMDATCKIAISVAPAKVGA